MIIIGERELKAYQDKKDLKVSVRTREGKDLGIINVSQFIKKLKEKIENFS
jgi:threonyl-tRNA synthetase